jgi:hypothetical protein
MDATDHATDLANAISEGINYLAYIRSLDTEPYVVSSEELLVWREALDDFQDSLKIAQEGKIEGYVLETSLVVSSELVLCIENVRAHLSVIAPGAPLPATLFNLIDLAWVEIEATMGPIRASPWSGEPPRMSS